MPRYTKTVWVNDSAPYINADNLNKIEAALEAASATSSVKATVVAGSTSASNYTIAVSGYSSVPTGTEIPFPIVFTPTVTNSIGATITTQWGNAQYPIFDVSTNAAITAGEIKIGQSIILIFDGAKFWFSGGGKYLKYGSAPNAAGYWDNGDSSPTDTTNHLSYNGVLHVPVLYGAVYNPESADIAEGYAVNGNPEPGDLIAIIGDEQFAVNTIPLNHRFIGVVSTCPAAMYGSNYGSIPVAVCGRVPVKVDGECNYGDLLVAGEHAGTVIATSPSDAPVGCVVGKALHSKYTDGIGLVLAIIGQV